MFKFSPALIVHKGSACYFLYAVGGLLMAVATGSRCVGGAVRTAQSPAGLLHLANTLIGLMGLRHQANPVRKRKPKRLFFTDSFNFLLHMTTTTLPGTHHLKVSGCFPEEQTNNCVSAGRCRIHYILFCGASTIFTLRLGPGSHKLKTYNPSNRRQWLMNFSSKAQARGDVIFFLLVGQISSHTKDATDERGPTGLTLGLSALLSALLWMFMPRFAICAVICFGWTLQQHVH